MVVPGKKKRREEKKRKDLYCAVPCRVVCVLESSTDVNTISLRFPDYSYLCLLFLEGYAFLSFALLSSRQCVVCLWGLGPRIYHQVGPLFEPLFEVAHHVRFGLSRLF